MSVNKYLPHVLILPEDYANRQLANGFLLEPALLSRSVQVLPEVGGWIKLLDCFESEHVLSLRRFVHRHLILLIDFDGEATRLATAKESIPPELKKRVFILGSLTEPEDLRHSFGSYETIGRGVARDCCERHNQIWNHDLLKHNLSEVHRLNELVWPILFGPLQK